MRILRPFHPALSRSLTILILVAWIAQMGLLLGRVRALSRPGALAADLARYGGSAQWRGIYLRGEKIGFSVTQTVPLADGYEIQEDGRLQMGLLGVTTVTNMMSRVQVGPDYELRSFSFALDPGTGPVEVSGVLEGPRRLRLRFQNRAGVREEVRDLRQTPALSLNMPRQLVAAGLAVGKRFNLMLLDPLTLRNAPLEIAVTGRDVVRGAGLPVPAYRLDTHFLGLEATMWMTETGEVVREESALGMLVVKETPQKAKTLGVMTARHDLLEQVSVVPKSRWNIPDARLIESMRLRLEGADALLASPDMRGGIQSVAGNEIALRSAADLTAGPLDPERLRQIGPEPLIESDDPAIRSEVAAVVQGIDDPRARAERLARHVHGLIEKRPTVSLPSAAEVLRTRVGDCNEHTVLYVALARAAGVPARIAVGLVYLLGAFHYHAWAEVYIEEPGGRGLWLPVDPTLDQFPADPSHVRLALGGLDRQAVIISVIGRIKIEILELKMRAEEEQRVLVGRAQRDVGPLDIPLPRRGGGGLTCWGDSD